MRKLLLNPTPLFRKLRQLTLLLSLLLALPLSVFGKGYRTTENVTDVTGTNAGTRFTWNTNATQTSTWRWVIDCEAGTVITPDINTLTFTLPAGKNITLSIDGYANDMSTVDIESLRKLILDGLSNNLTVSAYLRKGSVQYDFIGSNGVFTPNNWTQNMSTDGAVNITITNNSGKSVTCTINSITLLTGPTISSDGLAWPAVSPINELTKSVSNNVTTLSGSCAANTSFSFPLKRDEGNSTLSTLTEQYDIAYSSSNPSVAEVSDAGFVTIKGYGSTTITATLTENDYYSYDQSTYSYTLTNTESYGLTIAGTAVTSANASAITGTGITGAVSFDAANKILTLNGATIDGTIESSLDNLSIHLTGNNSISGNTTALLNGIKSTNGGTLTFTADANAALTITTTGDAASAITGFANVTMGTGAYLQTDIPTKYDTNGKNFREQVSSANIVKVLNITSTPSYPLWIGNTQFTSASTSIPTGFSFNATGNILTLTNVTQANPLISGLANLTIALSGDNSITKSDSSAVIRSINSQAALIIQNAGTGDCSLYLENNGSDPSASPVVKNFASINHTGLNYSSKSGSSINGASTHDAILSSATIYPLWIAGIPVTASTTSGTGWSYDAANNKLTLTNYNKTDNDGHAFISNMANLNVYLVGTNSVGSNIQISTDKAFYTTYTNATLTFSTDENNKGTLSASGYDTFCEGFRAVNGIYCNNGLGYYPSSKEIKAKATPTIKFAKRDQTSGAELSPAEYVGASETLQTAVNSAFKAPRPEYDNDYQLFVDSTRYTYSYAPEGIVEIPVTATDPSTGNNTFGEMNILKAGTVTITCTYPGNMQNEACSASYTLKVNKADANLAYNETTSNAYIDLSGNGQWGVPNGTGGTAPTLTKPTNVTGITYTSSNTNVATVSSTGDVTPIGAGEATITATLSNNDSYNDGNASYQLTVMVPATISFANATASVLNTATYTQAATTDPAGSTITYSSSNNNVSVDANGQVTINNPSFYGPVTITATLTAVPAATPQLYYVLADEPAFQATYTLNVAKNFDISSIFTDASMNYATCILSEQLTKPDGLKVYYITGTNGNTVTTQEIDYLPYGIPILLEKTAATIGSVTARTDSSSVVSGNLLQYATSDVSATGNQYVLYKNEFVKATGTIPTGKCYLYLTGVSGSRGMYGIGNDGSTAIEGIDVEATEDEKWYDLQGRRIQQPTKAGIYIVNGKKVIINKK